jgi:UDP-N-acetylmuramate: L-alanyl-gamma-D-glutamyl-meso-diaminopimelate ligase
MTAHRPHLHLHILGICGTFMGGIAAIAKSAGYRVTGCDANVYPPMSDQLRSLGIELTEGFGAEQLALRPDVWVVGNVVTRGNPLMEAILDAGAPYVSGPQWFAEHVLAGKHVLAVSGTHGKTTTSAMLAWIPDRRRAAGLPGLCAIYAGAAVRHRGGRVRHRLLRQALQVRALPSPDCDSQQYRVRSR